MDAEAGDDEEEWNTQEAVVGDIVEQPNPQGIRGRFQIVTEGVLADNS
jgi:hypothetical protein